MSDLNTSLHAMQFEQLLLAFAFLISYPLCLSRYVGVRGRSYAALAALMAAIGFSAMTTPWLNGVMMMVFAVVGLGVFIATVWAMSAVLGVAGLNGAGLSETLDEELQPQHVDECAVMAARRVHVHAIRPSAPRIRRPRGSFARRMLRSTPADALSRVRM